MEEVFKEYGTALISVIGGMVLLSIIILTFWGDHSDIARLLIEWGEGGL